MSASLVFFICQLLRCSSYVSFSGVLHMSASQVFFICQLLRCSSYVSFSGVLHMSASLVFFICQLLWCSSYLVFWDSPLPKSCDSACSNPLHIMFSGVPIPSISCDSVLHCSNPSQSCLLQVF
ncbi:unnamed protein product, partial [Staurois parvus]